jgi:small-conductance mechanosensitive channel
MDLSQKTSRALERTSDWLAANSLDLVLAILAALLITLALMALRSFGDRLLADRSQDLHWRAIFGRVLSRTSTLFILIVAIEIVAHNAATPPRLQNAMDIAFTIAATLQGAVWLRELILGILQHRLGEAEQHSTVGTAVGLIRGLVTAGLFAIALVLILDNLGVNVTGLVAGLGIGGIAIGLAAQGVFKDLFAAIAIIFDKPFRRGDGIKFDQVQGSVEQIGLKTTRIRALDGEEVIVSNAILLDKVVQNFSSVAARRMVIRFGLVLQTPPALIAAVPDLVRAAAGRHAHVVFVRSGLVGIGQWSLDFESELRFESASFDDFFVTRSAVLTELLQALDEQGARLAYPTQTSFTAGPGGEFVLPYHE